MGPLSGFLSCLNAGTSAELPGRKPVKDAKQGQGSVLKIIKLVIFLVFVGFLGLIGYTFFGDLEPDRMEVTTPVELNGS